MKISGGALDQALLGFQRATNGLRKEAWEVARATDPGADMDVATALVNMKQHELQAEASAEVVKAHDAMVGALFDDHA